MTTTLIPTHPALATALAVTAALATVCVDPAGVAAQDDGAAVDVGIDLTLEFAEVVAGGRARRAGALWNLDVVAELDGSAVGWRGGRAVVYLLGNAGTDPSRWAGDAQTASNIEAPGALRIFEAFVEQSAWDDRLSLLVGLRDLNADFYVIEKGRIFLHSSHGIGTEFAQTGVAGPSIFPVAALTAQMEARPVPGVRLRAAVRDAVPGDPDDPSSSEVNLSSREGLLLTGEVEFVAADDPARWRVVVGGWDYTENVGSGTASEPALLAARRVRAVGAASRDVVHGPVSDAGVYGIVEGRLAEVGGGTVDGFLRGGRADPDAYAVEWGWGGGAVWSGAFGRPDDALGVALAVADFSYGAGAEWAWEATWVTRLTDRLEASWDVQWIDLVDPPRSQGPGNPLILHQRFVWSF